MSLTGKMLQFNFLGVKGWLASPAQWAFFCWPLECSVWVYKEMRRPTVLNLGLFEINTKIHVNKNAEFWYTINFIFSDSVPKTSQFFFASAGASEKASPIYLGRVTVGASNLTFLSPFLRSAPAWDYAHNTFSKSNLEGVRWLLCLVLRPLLVLTFDTNGSSTSLRTSNESLRNVLFYPPAPPPPCSHWHIHHVFYFATHIQVSIRTIIAVSQLLWLNSLSSSSHVWWVSFLFAIDVLVLSSSKTFALDD